MARAANSFSAPAVLSTWSVIGICKLSFVSRRTPAGCTDQLDLWPFLCCAAQVERLDSALHALSHELAAHATNTTTHSLLAGPKLSSPLNGTACPARGAHCAPDALCSAAATLAQNQDHLLDSSPHAVLSVLAGPLIPMQLVTHSPAAPPSGGRMALVMRALHAVLHRLFRGLGKPVLHPGARRLAEPSALASHPLPHAGLWGCGTHGACHLEVGGSGGGGANMELQPQLPGRRADDLAAISFVTPCGSGSGGSRSGSSTTPDGATHHALLACTVSLALRSTCSAGDDGEKPVLELCEASQC